MLKQLPTTKQEKLLENCSHCNKKIINSASKEKQSERDRIVRQKVLSKYVRKKIPFKTATHVGKSSALTDSGIAVQVSGAAVC